MTDWSDVVARASGLRGRLLRPSQIEMLRQARNLPGLISDLERLGALGAAPEGITDPRTLESVLRRRAGARLRLLATWASQRAPRLAPLFDEEDLRSLRALVRGAAQGIPVEMRTQGLVPTPALPLRALEQLGAAADVESVAAQLLVFRHPFAGVVAEEARHQQLDLFSLDVALASAFAERARRVAEAGDAGMRHFVELAIDAQNLWTSLALAEGKTDTDPRALFVPGGAFLVADDLMRGARLHALAALVASLGKRLRGTPLAAALEPGERSREDALLDALVAEFRHLARREPLSSAPIVFFVLQQRAELRDLNRIIWSVALGRPLRDRDRARDVA